MVRTVPGTYVRDYRPSGGYLTICRGAKEVRVAWSNGLETVPRALLCNLTPGWTPRPTLMAGAVPVAPGWQMEMRKLARAITPNQRGQIARLLGRPDIFRFYERG